MNAWRVAFLGLFAASLWFFLAPGSGVPQPMLFPHADKAEHALLFAALAFLAARGFDAPPSGIAGPLLAYGFLVEVVQSYVPGRGADPFDFVADAVGVGVGLLIARPPRRG
ncbi:MAG TPA: VanZ family protein [Candidatus Thermoplasmatota archaeon]|nr:VanZ family protein [Candidatus Thermoplasmatota archaeon]